MLPSTSPRKKLKSPGQETPHNPKTTITCTNVPESLFEPNAATKHFSKFGRVVRIKLFPRKQACVIEFDQPRAIEQAVLNAGAYDGFMFDVIRMKPRVRKRSKAENDPDWVPDSDVAQELSAMRGGPTYVTRNKSMDVSPDNAVPKVLKRVIKQTVRKVPVQRPQPKPRTQPNLAQPVSGVESPVVVTMQTTKTTSEAASELHQLRFKISLSADEMWRTLDARDRILRSWGGAGSRVKVGGATIGTCQDMCPEKELLHRQAEHQIMLLETDSQGVLEPRRAVKQYSRSSADQEIPMCYELRPAPVLMKTCSYLLQEVADTTRQINLADWFHFMWDRFRGIRKDIAQQALCCAESINLVEMCARFHAHCAARLADLEHTQFDQKLNTDNLTKCLQTLKHMYADVTEDQKPREAEFRGYIALLNLGDANFWWEIKQLPEKIQKSEPITFAIKVFNALDNNNYVRFFRLVKEKATYLQACILLRYFNDVRARALARIVKAYAPRGGSRFPASDLFNAIAFESIEKMKAFINHYGLRFAKADDYELSVILDRNQFIEDSDPFATSREIKLIESKRQSTVGQVIAGGNLPNVDFLEHTMHTSFTKEGRLKETALVAEEQHFNTMNDSNKNVKALKAEIEKLANGGKPNTESPESKTLFVKPAIRTPSPRRKAKPVPDVSDSKSFTFKPAITVASTEIISNSPEKTFNTEEIFSFSKPEVTQNDAVQFVTPPAKTSGFSETESIFTRTTNENNGSFQKAQNVFGTNNTLFTKPDLPNKPADNVFTNPEQSLFGRNAESKLFSGDKKLNDNLFSKPEQLKSVFSQNITEQKKETVFSSKPNESLFSKPDIPKSLFGQNMDQKTEKLKENLFSKPESVFGQISAEFKVDKPKSVFGQSFGDAKHDSSEKVFGLKTPQSNNTESKQSFVPNNIFASAKDSLSMSKPDSAVQFENSSNIFAKAASNLGDSNQGNSIFTNSMQKTGDAKSNIFATASEQTKQSNSIFGKPVQISETTKPGNNIFANTATVGGEIKPTSIFGAFNKQADPKNIFANPDVIGNQKPSIFASNGDVPGTKLSPGSFFKGAINPPNGSDAKSYSIFQSKNKAQTVADNIYNSLMAPKNDTASNVYDFNQEAQNDEQHQTELQHLREEKIKQEEEKKLQEKLRKEEEKRREEQQRQEEERRKAEEKRQKEEKIREEQRRLEDQRKKEELRKKLEEEKKAELKRKVEEEQRKILEAADKESNQLVEELLSELNNETTRELLKEEHDNFVQLMNLAGETTEEIISILSNEICFAEIQAEFFLTRKIMRKWFDVWRRHYIRNLNRRKWLDDTPVWLPNRDPIEQASFLRRKVEKAALKSMNDFHRGYKFSGELKLLPPPEPYNIMEIIRSPLLKRMKQICYPYDKCFFWKVTLVSPGANQWLCRKINVENWLMEAFGDKKPHEESETLIHVGKYSWNRLMDFAISVSLAKRENKSTCVEAVEGTNGLLFYSTENDTNLLETIVDTVKNKYANQVIPIAVIMPHQNDATHNAIQTLLAEYVNSKIISGYKIFVLDPQSINELLNTSTKSALKWLAKKCPEIPPIEIDYLKSICQRYLGNELWCKFRAERDSRMSDVLKDIQKLINCYNAAVDKLTEAITNEELFNYPPFPLELKSYLEQGFPYPKAYEFIPSNVRTSENVSMVRDIMKLLKLPDTLSVFKPQSAVSMQHQIRSYCNQIAWFEDPEKVVCKVVAVLPHELSDLNMSCEDFMQYFENYDLIDFLNVIIYEKINCLNNFDNRFAVYEKSVLQEYCNMNWLYEVKSLLEMKHKALDYEDEADYFIKAKRRKIAMESLEYLMLEDNDSTLVETSIQESNADISKYSDCSKAVKQLEEEIEEETKKSVELEKMLRAALEDV